MKRKILILIIVIFIINAFGCTKRNFRGEEDFNLYNENDFLESNITVWTVYWDTEVDEQLEKYKDYIDSISYFAADFNENNNIVLRDKTKEQLSKYKNSGKKNIISIVNDKILKDGTSIAEDTDLLKDIYSSDEKINTHIEEIIEIVKENNFDIVEIDYEQLKMI